MKTKQTVLILAILCGCLAHANDRFGLRNKSCQELLALYNEVDSSIFSRIQMEASTQVVSNVFSIYAAGYIHSSLAIEYLLDIIDIPGENDIPKMYYEFQNTPSISEKPKTIQPIINTPTRNPKPPSPSVAALTQMPVTLARIENELEKSQQGTRKQELLSYVALVKFEETFLGWLFDKAEGNPEKWRQLYLYCQQQKAKVQSFSMDIYRAMIHKQFPREIALYDSLVSELASRFLLVVKNEEKEKLDILETMNAIGNDRIVIELERRLAAAKENGDESEVETILSALKELGVETPNNESPAPGG